MKPLENQSYNRHRGGRGGLKPLENQSYNRHRGGRGGLKPLENHAQYISGTVILNTLVLKDVFPSCCYLSKYTQKTFNCESERFPFGS